MSLKGKIIVIVAPSGTGKSTLISKLMNDLDNLSWSVSCTTRPKRSGEIDGKDYFFITEKEFLIKKDNNEFVEWAQVHANYYGTLKSYIDDGISSGKNLLFDLDVQGCDQIKQIYGDEANVIFIEPPSVKELENRLTKRATDSRDVIERRLKNALSELSRKDDYDYKVTNNEFDKALVDLKLVVEEILEK